ncbi:MAG TPA: 4Fe-4S binding protein [Methanosarcinaceae archaeon]|nr:4Fe-4S binding protein [Methanosarcinaceae archaeon]
MRFGTLFSIFILLLIIQAVMFTVPALAEGDGKGMGDGNGHGSGKAVDPESILTGLASTKYILGGLAAFSGLVLLKTISITRNIRTALMSLVFILFGMVVIMHQPGILSSVIDSINALLTGGAPTFRKITMVIFISILSLIGAKMFCGWVCPFGALQEIMNGIPLLRDKNIRLPFKITNTVRILLFVLSLLLIFMAGIDVYTYRDILNPFGLFDWKFDIMLVFLVSVVLIASLVVYRPFCYFACPVGLLTWLLEHVSIFRIRLDPEKCTHCNICVSRSPCPSIEPIIAGETLRPDCFSCGRCIAECPQDALGFITLLGTKK